MSHLKRICRFDLSAALIGTWCAFVVLGSEQVARAAPAPISGDMVAVTLDSGRVDNLASTDRVVFSEIVDLGPDVPWVRVIFSDASLPPGSAVRVTSLFDGESQTLDADELARWYNGTAFFNGSSVQVELIAGPRTTGNSIRIAEVYAGDMIAQEGGGDVGEVAAICGTTDDRTQVTIGEKLAVGRLLSGTKKTGKNVDPRGVCTGFIIDSPPGDPNKLHLTAGHCFGNVNQDLKEPWILQFDVPKSNVDCTIVHPPISHQWIVNGAEVISRDDGPGAIGNDYAIFGCYPHQTDKATTFERRGAAYVLASTTPDTANVQVVGYGTDGGNDPNACGGCVDGDVDAAKNFVLQTDKGAAKTLDDPDGSGKSVVGHDADTCGGNSGSPIVDQGTGLVIGIHTNGGCKGDAAQNFGTRIDDFWLQWDLQREKDKIVRDFGSECAPGQLPPCDEVTLSFGTFQILVDEVYRDWMDGYPGYDDLTKILTSPRLFDPDTVIGRSFPHLDDDPTDLAGTLVGKKGTVISDASFSYVPTDKDQEGFAEGPSLITREVHTELVSLDLCERSTCDPNAYDCACVLAGQSAKQKVLPISPGEVESKSSRANPLEDFPAESFFNIFAEVWVPQGGSAPFPGVVLDHTDPLLITNNQLADLPPSVIYRHGNARAVPVYFNTDPPKGQIGDEFGRLILAGHGVAMEETDFDTEAARIVPMCVEPNSLGCWSGCLLCENDPGCDTALDPVPTGLVREELNFSPVDLALVAPPEVNRFSEAVLDVLNKQAPAPQIVQVSDMQDVIAAIQAKPGRHTVIFAHGSAGHFRIGPDDLADPAVQDKFIAGAKGQIKELFLFGCEVGLDQVFLKKLTDGLQLPIHTWEGKVYAFGHDPVIPIELQNGFFIEVGTDKKEIPAVTPLGLVVMVILVLAAGAVVIKRARTQRVQG